MEHRRYASIKPVAGMRPVIDSSCVCSVSMYVVLISCRRNAKKQRRHAAGACRRQVRGGFVLSGILCLESPQIVTVPDDRIVFVFGITSYLPPPDVCCNKD